MIYTINGITIEAEAYVYKGETAGYLVNVNGARVGNRIDRLAGDDPDHPTFESIARNELVIGRHDTLRDAVADVINEGMRDRTRR